MKFNVGDKVLIRQHTEEEKEMYPFGWVEWMDHFEGGVGTITRIDTWTSEPCHRVHYKCAEGEGDAFFPTSSLSLVGYEQF